MKFEQPIPNDRYCALKLRAYSLVVLTSGLSQKQRENIIETNLEDNQLNDWETKIFLNTFRFPNDLALFQEMGNSMNFDFKAVEEKFQMPHDILEEKLVEYTRQDFRKVLEILDCKTTTYDNPQHRSNKNK